MVDTTTETSANGTEQIKGTSRDLMATESNQVECMRPLERFSCPPDHLLLRKQTWLLSPAVNRPRGILWRCATEEIGVPAATGVRSRAPVQIGDGDSAAVSWSVMRC